MLRLLCFISVTILHVAAQNTTALQPITITAPSSLTRCGPNLFTWTGGVPPFSFFSSIPGVQVTQLSAAGLTSRSYSFSTIWAPGYRLNFQVSGANDTSGSLTGVLVSQGPCDIISSTTTTSSTITLDAGVGPTSSQITTITPITTLPAISPISSIASTPAVMPMSSTTTTTTSPAAPVSVSSPNPDGQRVDAVSQTPTVYGSSISSVSRTPTPTDAVSDSPNNTGTIAGGAAGGVIVLLAVIILLVWRRRRQAGRGNFTRVDLTDRPNIDGHHDDKPELSDTAYQITTYAQQVPISTSRDAEGGLGTPLEDSENPRYRIEAEQTSHPEKPSAPSTPGTHSGLSPHLQSDGYLSRGNRSSLVAAVEEAEGGLRDILPPNYQSVMGQSSYPDGFHGETKVTGL